MIQRDYQFKTGYVSCAELKSAMDDDPTEIRYWVQFFWWVVGSTMWVTRP